MLAKKVSNCNKYCSIEHNVTERKPPHKIRALERGFRFAIIDRARLVGRKSGRYCRLLKQLFRDVVGNDAADHTHAQSNKYFEHNAHLPPQAWIYRLQRFGSGKIITGSFQIDKRLSLWNGGFSNLKGC